MSKLMALIATGSLTIGVVGLVGCFILDKILEADRKIVRPFALASVLAFAAMAIALCLGLFFTVLEQL